MVSEGCFGVGEVREFGVFGGGEKPEVNQSRRKEKLEKLGKKARSSWGMVSIWVMEEAGY